MTDVDNSRVSIILPAKNEAASLKHLLPELKNCFPESEIIVVDDGSNDTTVEVCESNNVTCLQHQYSKGNGAAIKSGTRAATGEILVFMDADGQHLAEEITKLLDVLEQGYDMVVGARKFGHQANYGRGLANTVYNKFASLVTGHLVKDLTSGFRVVRAEKFKEFLYMLPNGFSYPSTITMAFFRVGYSVVYAPINVKNRIGKSHIRPLRDGLRFLLIIFRITTLYSPLKIFLPISSFVFLVGFMYYIYTYITDDRFTNMSALLILSAISIFLVGLVSEQITMLLYKKDAK
ncbi:glycosyltransferase involved in cell wall biosynthesis [Methylohalomonas lacus]|uniref:Glycosyltransferase involved in cell wall biosynthesis n=1 Tax=Methylohalomonas lacus TaxID=398773 RepID=A0AAE3HMI9_9GAMM|nr:glycosyltransferase family 2 protein [Methylohalomonas lacus]MCS3903884.1 glycosyltransferase involved in cell wall biosynthesis [Methylohalomonas lacus]